MRCRNCVYVENQSLCPLITTNELHYNGLDRGCTLNEFEIKRRYSLYKKENGIEDCFKLKQSNMYNKAIAQDNKQHLGVHLSSAHIEENDYIDEILSEQEDEQERLIRCKVYQALHKK